MVQYKLKQRGFYYFNSIQALAFLCVCVCVCISVCSLAGVKGERLFFCFTIRGGQIDEEKLREKYRFL